MTGHYRCTRCGVTTRHDHDGNGCHSCGSGVMRFIPDDTAPAYQMWPNKRKRDYDEDGGTSD